jgi:hypothetical protein
VDPQGQHSQVDKRGDGPGRAGVRGEAGQWSRRR